MIPLRGRLSGLSATVAALSTLPSIVVQGAEGAAREGLTLLSNRARSTYLSGPYPTYLQPRSGRLRASLRRGDKDNIWQVSSQGTKISATLGSKTPYAKIHETGGEIRPVKGQYLAIPASFILSPSGQVKAAYRKPLRQIENTFFVTSRRGGLSLWQRGPGKRSKARPIYWLVKRVRIPKRPFLEPALRDTADDIRAAFQAMITRISTRAMETLNKIRRAA